MVGGDHRGPAVLGKIAALRIHDHGLAEGLRGGNPLADDIGGADTLGVVRNQQSIHFGKAVEHVLDDVVDDRLVYRATHFSVDPDDLLVVGNDARLEGGRAAVDDL